MLYRANCSRFLAVTVLLLMVAMGVLVGCSDESEVTRVIPTSAENGGSAVDKTYGGDGIIGFGLTPYISGEVTVGILLIEFTDTPDSDRFSMHPEFADSILARMFTNANSVDALYREMSGGSAGFTGELVGGPGTYYEIDGALNTSCSTSAHSDWNSAAIAAAGTDVEGYDVLMCVMSEDNVCYPHLLSSASGSWTQSKVTLCAWDFSPTDYAHELGHLFGFDHSNKDGYGDTGEYGDYSCIMGENAEYFVGAPTQPVPLRHLNAIWKIAAGWIDHDDDQALSEIHHVEGGGTHTVYLAPTEYDPGEIVDPAGGGTTYRAARVVTNTGVYYVSYRQARPPFDIDPLDGTKLGQTMNRVSVHTVGPGSNGYGQKAWIEAVLEASPGTDTFVGDGVTITALDDGLSGEVDYVAVQVELPDCHAGVTVVCDEPTVLTTTAPKYFMKFPVEVTNLSAPECGAETFSYVATQLSGAGSEPLPPALSDFTCVGGQTVTIEPGFSFISSAPTEGVHAVDVDIYDGATLLHTERLTWILDSTPPNPPTNVNAQANGCGVTVTWHAVTDDTSGIDHYLVLRDGVVVGQSATTSFSETLSDMASGQTVTYRVKAVDNVGFTSLQSAASSVQMTSIIISNVKTSKINSFECTKTVTWTTNVPSTSLVEFGTFCGNLGYVAQSAGMTTNHSVVCDVSTVTSFAFTVSSSDGCVTATTACVTRPRGICVWIE